MSYIFGKLLLTNFRCGRMFYTRTAAGAFAAPVESLTFNS